MKENSFSNSKGNKFRNSSFDVFPSKQSNSGLINSLTELMNTKKLNEVNYKVIIQYFLDYLQLF